MKQKKSRLMIAAVAVILLAVLISSAIGKYVTTVSVPGKVTFTAKLAGGMVLQEHKAERNADGSYTLTGQIATADENGYFNGYDLIPGLDIPKDPHIVITGKTDVKAYLFVEVVENGDVGLQDKVITYAMTNDWLKLTGTGKNGGTVYVYKGTGTSGKALDHNIGSPWTVQILAPLAEDNNNHIRVSQKLITTGSTGDDMLTFYASMGEAAMGASPTEVYKTMHNIT